MNTATVQPKGIQSLVALFGIVSALLVVGVPANVTIQFGLSDRVAFFALVVLGLTMCGMGKLGLGAVYGWANPLHLAGYVLGTIGLIIAALVWFNVPVPFITGERTAIVVLAMLMLVKVRIAQLYRK